MIALLKVWIAYAIWGVALYSLVFAWAVRNRQFTELDRQRRIALDVSEPADARGDSRPTPGWLDRYTWLLLSLVALGVVVMAILAAVYCRHGSC